MVGPHYSDKGEQYLGISEVKKFASEVDMDDYEVESFLEFHHVLGDLICCQPSELGNFIITDPKWLLDEFNLAYSFMSRQRKKGIICSRVLKKHWRDNAQFLTDLMINIGSILPLDSDKNVEQTYLIPLLLPVKDNHLHGLELTYRAIHKPNIDDILSFATFFRLLAFCARESNWKLNIGGHLSHNSESFEVTKGTLLVVTQMKNNTIQFSTWTSKQELDKEQVSNDEIRGILFDMHKDIARNMEVLGIEQSKNFLMICPYWRPGDEFLCLIEIEQKPDGRPDNFVFYPTSEKCAIHNKTLGPRLFYANGEHRKGM